MSKPEITSQVGVTTSAEPARGEGVTRRAILLGLALVIFLNLFINYLDYIVRSSKTNLNHFSIALFFSYALLTLLLNPILQRCRHFLGFSRSEFLVALALGLLGSILPTAGLTGFFLGIIASPYYFATPENGWAEYLHPHLPAWFAPSQKTAMQWLFEGLPEGIAIPWDVWIVPLLWWSCLIAAMTLGSICLAVVLRRQWSEHERLIYPMLMPALAIIEGDERLPDILRHRIFWIGAGLAFVAVSWNIGSFFSPLFPAIPQSLGNLVLGGGLPSIPLRLNFFLMGFTYFANVEVLGSFWVFLLFFLGQVWVFNRVGFDIGPNGDLWSSHHSAYSWQGMGAMTAFVGWSLWIGRHHIRSVIATAFAARGGLDDRGEMVSYRTAFWGLVLSAAFIVGWLHYAGMELSVVWLFLFATFVIHLGIARIVAESGLISVRGPMTAQSFCFYSLGSASVAQSSMTVLGFSYALLSHGQGLFLPALVHAVKLTDIVRANRRRMLLALLGALVVGTLVSLVYTLHLGYSLGAYNFNPLGPFSSGPRRLLGKVVGKMGNPFPPSGWKITFFWLGIAIMSALLFLRYRFPWWPINPIGFPISGTSLIRISALPIFIVWTIKIIVLRTGGALLYRRIAPFFIGLTVGHAMAVGISAIVDIIWFNGRGHMIYTW